ncbi:MAG TPA: hypothetical protein VGM21_13920 [Actinomycetota bacterium]
MRRLASLLVPALLAGAVAAGPAHRADAACAAAGRVISGGVRGSDGRAVNVFIGIDALDRAGHHLQLNGCTGGSGYTTHLHLNRTLPPSGGSSGQVTWRVRLPANAATAWIETYPKDTHGSTDTSFYGSSMRRKVAIGPGVNLRLPVVCGRPGGLTGGVHGYVTLHGQRIKPDRAIAWSMYPDTDPSRKILGFGIGAGASNGFYSVYKLARNQRYDVRITITSPTSGRRATKRIVNVPVRGTCQNTPLNVSFG